MMKLPRGMTRIQAVQGILVLLSAGFIVLPLAEMFFHMDAESICSVLGGGGLWDALSNSLRCSVWATIISLVLAYVMAGALNRSAISGKRVFRVLISLPMLIPSVSIGMGVIILGGNSGILTELLGIPVGGIYGFWGILCGSVIYSLPVAFLMIDNILKYENMAPYEAAQVLGISSLDQFRAISLPYLKKPMISVFFSIFTLSFTDYGVPLMVGGKYRTLPVVLYQEVIGQLNFGRGCVYGSILLIPAVLAFLVDLSSGNQKASGQAVRHMDLRQNRKRDALLFCYACVLVIICVLPIVSFVVLSFVKQYPGNLALTTDHLVKTIRMGADRYLRNSIVIALTVAVAGTAIAVGGAYFSARVNSPISRVQHLVFLSTGAIPGVVLGLAYVLFFRGNPLYGSIFILIIVNVVHFISSPYLTMYNAFSKVSENLESVAATLRIGRARLLFDIMVPMCKKTVSEVFAYLVVNSMMTISAVSFLSRARIKPLALMINQFEAQAQMECAAVVSLAILLVNLTLKIIPEFMPERKR